MPLPTSTTLHIDYFQSSIKTMAHSPNQDPHSPSFASFPASRQAGTSPSSLGVPESAPTRTTSPTQYQFIMQTGDESVATAKQNLKTVRSHVMKNYLHQQQQRQSGVSGEGSFATASGTKREEKQRARSARSASRESRQGAGSPAVSEGGRERSASTDVGSMFSALSFSIPFSGPRHSGLANSGEWKSVSHHTQQSPSGQPRCFPWLRPLWLTMCSCSAGHGQPFTFGFSSTPPQDEVSAFAQQYIAVLAQDKRAGLLEPSFETLKAKGETMRIVQNTLTVCGNSIPQSIIFAVSLLAYGCVGWFQDLRVRMLTITRLLMDNGTNRGVTSRHCSVLSRCEEESPRLISNCKGR